MPHRPITGNRTAGWFRELVPSVPAAYLVAGLFHLGLMAFVVFTIRTHPGAPGDRPA